MTNESSEQATAAIRAHAEGRIRQDGDDDQLFAAEVLAGIEDGTVVFADLDDDVVEVLLKTYGVELIARTVAAAEPVANQPEVSRVATLTAAPGVESMAARTAPAATSGHRRMATWWPVAASIVVIGLVALMYLMRPRATGEPDALARETTPSEDEPAAPVPSSPTPAVPELELALQWVPELPTALQRGERPPLAQVMPDFERAPVGGTLGGGAGESPFQPMQLKTVIVKTENGWGSGAFVSADGWLITNYHVVEDAAQKAAATGAAATVEIIPPSVVGGQIKPGSPLRARVYRADPVVDLALLRLDPAPAMPVSYFRLGATATENQEVIVIGSQGNGPAWWVRRAILSSTFDFPTDLSQNAAGVSSSGPTLARARLQVHVTDARVSPGDSGGPLLNANGELIGVTFATSANESAGAVGWHIAVPQVRAFLARSPTSPESVPFDVWTAGLGESVAFEAGLVDGDRDGRVDTARYTFAQPPSEGRPARPLARSMFIDFAQRTPRTDAFADVVPSGLWGLDRGRFRFDLFLATRADGLAAVGYTNPQGVLTEVRLGQNRSETATSIWARNADGRWHVSSPPAGTPLIDAARLGPERMHRLQLLTGEQLVLPRGGGSPRGTQPPGTPPSSRGRGPNKM